MTTLNNQLIIVGGKDKHDKATNKMFSLDGNQLKEYTRMTKSRSRTIAAGHQNILIIIGGRDDEGWTLATTELFDSGIKGWFTTGQWYTVSNLPMPQYGLQSVIADNVLYVLGGFHYNGNNSSSVFTVALDTVSGHQLKWNSKHDTPWCHSTPICMLGKHLHTIGGVKGHEYTKDIHSFNKVNHSWDVMGQILSKRGGPAAVCVADNTIVVIGGWDGQQYTNTVWIGFYEPQ